MNESYPKEGLPVLTQFNMAQGWMLEYPDYNNDKDNYLMFRPFFKDFKEPVTGVEVGTFEGYNALGLCRFVPINKLYCVDPYMSYQDVVADYMTRINQETWEQLFLKAQARLKDFPVEFLRMTSQEGAEKVPDNLDFAYIDGDHSIEGVTRDIETWYPKVRKGGLLGGHDANEPSVMQALAEWVYSDGRYAGKLHYGWSDWWIVKND